jgi:hypothetical protein
LTRQRASSIFEGAFLVLGQKLAKLYNFLPAENQFFKHIWGKKAKNFQYLLNLKNQFQKKKKSLLRFIFIYIHFLYYRIGIIFLLFCRVFENQSITHFIFYQ